MIHTAFLQHAVFIHYNYTLLHTRDDIAEMHSTTQMLTLSYTSTYDKRIHLFSDYNAYLRSTPQGILLTLTAEFADGKCNKFIVPHVLVSLNHVKRQFYVD